VGDPVVKNIKGIRRDAFSALDISWRAAMAFALNDIKGIRNNAQKRTYSVLKMNEVS
jgi:hypothetical protein